MKQKFYNLKINTNGQKLYDFTDQTIEWIKKNDFKGNELNKESASKKPRVSSIDNVTTENLIERHIDSKKISSKISRL